MFLLRRTAFRTAMSKATAAPSVIVPKARTFITIAQLRGQPAQRWTVSSMQRRFASDEAATDAASTEAIAETPAPGENEVTEGTAAETSTEAPTETSADVAAEEAVAEPEAGEEAAAAVEPADAAAAETSATEAVDSAAASAAAVGAAAAAAVGFQDQPASRSSSDQIAPNSTIYVGNIFFEVSEQTLENHFLRFGPIKRTKIVYDGRGLSKGFGYIEFENVEDATRAIESSNQQVFQGRRMAVQFHRVRQSNSRRPPQTGSNPPSKTLFIGNMSFEMSDKDLSDLFREVRNVIDVRIAIDRRTGQPRGFAHADFIDIPSATKAMEFLSKKELYGRTLRVDYSLSTPRE